jgi:hypothetical protein
VSEWLYVARTGAACIEVGGSLECLTEEITDTWEPGGEDVAIWLHVRGTCRLVALVRDDQGSASVFFLEGTNLHCVFASPGISAPAQGPAVSGKPCPTRFPELFTG